jgi:hypothetical protein
LRSYRVAQALMRLRGPQAHSDVIQKLLKKARKGTKSASTLPQSMHSQSLVSITPLIIALMCLPLPLAVVVMPGNHDEALRDYLQDHAMELGENMCVPLRKRGARVAC